MYRPAHRETVVFPATVICRRCWWDEVADVHFCNRKEDALQSNKNNKNNTENGRDEGIHHEKSIGETINRKTYQPQPIPRNVVHHHSASFGSWGQSRKGMVRHRTQSSSVVEPFYVMETTRDESVKSKQQGHEPHFVNAAGKDSALVQTYL